MAELALAGQAAWFELLSRRGAESVGMAGGLAVVSGLGSNTENGVVACRATLADEGAVGMLVDWVARRAVPASLIVAEPVEPELLAPLLAHGLVAERAGTEMGMALTDARLPPATVPGVDVVEVADAGTLGDGLAALGSEWFEDGELERRVAVGCRIGYGPGSAARHWVAYQSATAVGMATSFTFDDVVVLQHCGVVPTHRRRGIATALTGARLEAASEDCARLAVLSPSPDGFELHSRLGFHLVPARPDRWFYFPMHDDASG